MRLTSSVAQSCSWFCPVLQTDIVGVVLFLLRVLVVQAPLNNGYFKHCKIQAQPLGWTLATGSLRRSDVHRISARKTPLGPLPRAQRRSTPPAG